MLLAEKKEKIHLKTKKFISKLNFDNSQELENEFNEFVDIIIEDIHNNTERKVERSELSELIQEMHYGFKTMEKRFEAIDNRFEYLEKSLEKRFESIDKRFEDMNKRFEDNLHYMDKRFEDINKRFTLLQWTIILGFGVISTLMTFLKFFHASSL